MNSLFNTAKMEITHPSSFYSDVRKMWNNEVHGGLVYELYNSTEAAEQWNKFNAKGRVVGAEADLIKQLIRRHRQRLVAPAVIEGGPGGWDALQHKSKPLVLAAMGDKKPDDMNYTGIEASRSFRETIVQYYAGLCQVTATDDDFFKPMSIRHRNALMMVLGVTMSNLPSKPDDSLPLKDLVDIIGNFAEAVGQNGQIVFSTDSFDSPEMSGERFVEGYNDYDFRKVYHVNIDRQMRELGLVIHNEKGPVLDRDGKPTNIKLDGNFEPMFGEDGHRLRYITPNFVWTGEEVDPGDKGHKVAHNFQSNLEDISLRFPDYSVDLLKGEERTALNAIKWKSTTIQKAIDELGNVYYIDRLQADNKRTTLHYLGVGDGGDGYRSRFIQGNNFASPQNQGINTRALASASRPAHMVAAAMSALSFKPSVLAT